MMLKHLSIVTLAIFFLVANASAAILPSSLLSRISGLEGPFRTLILIQDPATRRGTGGTIVSAVEILMDQGELVSKRAYSKEELGHGSGQRVSDAPAPLPYEISRFSKALSMVNANYFLDAKKTGTVIAKLWQERMGSSLDMVVFDSTMPPGRLFNNETAVSPSNDKDATERKRMVDFEVLKNEKVEEKQIFFFSPRPKLQEELGKAGISAELPINLEQKQDFLMVASLNLEENRLNTNIREHVALFTTVKDDGRIINRLRIIRWHVGDLKLPYHSITRVLVPSGSRILETKGIEKSAVSSMDKNPALVFSYEKTIEPGQREETELFYELPFQFDTKGVDSYRLKLAKQPGVASTTMKWILRIPSSMTLFERSPEAVYLRLNKDLELKFTAGKKPGNGN